VIDSRRNVISNAVYRTFRLKEYSSTQIERLVRNREHRRSFGSRPSNPHGLTVRLTVCDANSRSHGFAS